MLTKLHSILVVSLGLAFISAPVKGADTYSLDPVHSSITFMIEHMGISYVHGRFNEFSSDFTVDKDTPAKSSFALTIKTNSVDTAVKKRDDHLRSPDFFNVKEFPSITFQSTSVKAAKDGYDVTGDFTMHGVKKAITFNLQGGKTIQQKGTRIGFYTNLTVNRKDFGVGSLPGLGDDVKIFIGMEGIKK